MSNLVRMMQKAKIVRRQILGFCRLHKAALGKADVDVGKHFYCGKHLWISRSRSLRCGDRVYLGNFNHIGVDLNIGNDVLIASHVAFVGGDHSVDIMTEDTPIRQVCRRPIVVEDGVWVGHGAIILHGVTIGHDAIVAAGAVVTHDVRPYSIVGGVPARHIRFREEKQ